MRTEEAEKREKQIKPMTWHSVNRHKFFDEARVARIQDQYTVADLRKILKGWTWEDVCKATLSGRHMGGVYFHGRCGRFLARQAIAVCAVNKIVVLRYIVARDSFLDGAIITGQMGDGFGLMQSDFISRIKNIKITDPVIGSDE